MSKHDVWLEAIVDYAREQAPQGGGIFNVAAADVLREIRERTGGEGPTGHRLAKYIEEKQQIFKDFGFSVRRKRIHGGIRVYEFAAIA
jgi:hypothetical protein